MVEFWLGDIERPLSNSMRPLSIAIGRGCFRRSFRRMDQDQREDRRLRIEAGFILALMVFVAGIRIIEAFR